MRQQRTYLMSPPSRYWRAEGNAYAKAAKARGGSNPRAALLEWIKVADLLTRYGAQIVVIPPGPREVFDMVYVADIGRWFEGGFFFANFAAEHRKNETNYAHEIFKQLGLPILGQAEHKWEGSSCVRISPNRTTAFLGYGVRAGRESCQEIAGLLDANVTPLYIQMKEPHIHLDTLLACLYERETKIVLVCRSAFADKDENGWNPHEAWGLLWEACEAEGTKVISVSKADGALYATNVRQEPNGRIFAAEGLSKSHIKQLREYDYKVHSLSLPCLFRDGGGASACLTNHISRAVDDGWVPPDRFLYEAWRPKIMRWVDKYPEHEI
ncbi:hypothetical protein A3A40_02135 [Candidatus Kaiserbacteria bacterium RIFCSPLOWO2_01_FULL_54_20]|uniref:Amidinotransferase n=1 Tax=Candidatus Kaiserbacteria bacterium RIFCSPLOWO2_01_FULL_54_20 TaxID=1798513 RepID=A0A1F6EJU3_9BACT|nr:MAG: hypothetical protein A3A40_02135 [Candidatus Kaiserbacteria bacterium RIFCSPLOWO2_01_FULL_54_20]